MRFSFVGELDFNTKEDAKVPAVREIGDTGLGINATVIASKNNRAYLESVGWQNDTILSKDTDGNNIEINWDDRDDAEVIKSVAGYRKNVISIGDKRKEFITSYDFCEFIKDHIDDLKGKRFVVTGQTQENFYNGKESKRFQMSNLYAIDKDDERKNKLEIVTEVFWDKDSVDTNDFKDEKKIYVNGYTQEYLSAKDLGLKKGEKGQNRYIPIQLVLDCSRIDFDNEDHVNRMNYNLMNLGLVYKDGKISNKLKSGKYYSNEIVISYFNGAQDMGDASEITYDMLTEMQKMKVDLGMAKPEDFAANGNSYGDRIVEYRITNFPNKNGKYQDGMAIVEETAEEFEDKIYLPPSQKETEEEIDDELPFGDMPEPVKDEDEEEEEKPKKKATKTKTSTKKKKVEEVEEEPDEEDSDEDYNDLFG